MNRGLEGVLQDCVQAYRMRIFMSADRSICSGSVTFYCT